MQLPEFSIENLCPKEQSEISEVVWRAAEVLRTFVVIDDFEVYDPTLQVPDIEVIDEDDENYDELIVNDENNLDYIINGHSTEEFSITTETSGVLSNVPLLVDDYGKLQQLTEPGYIALLVYENYDIDTINSERTLDGVGAGTNQITFRLPWHNEGAAIFEGFRLENEDRIDENPQALSSLEEFLEDLVDILRYSTEIAVKNGIDECIILQIPSRIAHCAISDFLTVIDNNS